MFNLSGKVALVTGASRGLGWAMAQSLASAGAHVILNARDEAALKERVKELAAKGLKGDSAAFDVTDHAAGAACIGAAARKHGRFDILVANAGIQHRKPITEFDAADFERVVATNLTAVWALAKEAAKVMIPAKRGRIIMTGSVSAILARPTISAYIASKGAVGLMTKAMALDHARENIRVNAVCPGDTLVDRWIEKGYFEGSDPVTIEDAMKEASAYIPMGRFGKPEEIAKAVLFLASDDSSFVTGHLLLVDGGNTAQ